MPGRVEIDDVAPVVSCGAYPAKAVVGEVIPVRASVWREGHDAVSATLVVRYLGSRYPLSGETKRLKAVPAPAAAPTAPEPLTDPTLKVKPLHIGMTPGVEPFSFHGAFTSDVLPRLEEALARAASEGVTDTHALRQLARRVIGKWVSDNYRRRPMIIPVVVET